MEEEKQRRSGNGQSVRERENDGVPDTASGRQPGREKENESESLSLRAD